MKGKEKENTIVLDMPENEGDATYIGLLFRVMGMVGSVIVDSRGDDDYRISLLCDLAISVIPDREIRQNLRAMKKEEIEKRCTDSCSADAKNIIKRDVSIEMLGYVSDELDKSIGIRHKNKVAIEALP